MSIFGHYPTFWSDPGYSIGWIAKVILRWQSVHICIGNFSPTGFLPPFNGTLTGEKPFFWWLRPNQILTNRRHLFLGTKTTHKIIIPPLPKSLFPLIDINRFNILLRFLLPHHHMFLNIMIIIIVILIIFWFIVSRVDRDICFMCGFNTFFILFFWFDVTSEYYCFLETFL